MKRILFFILAIIPFISQGQNTGGTPISNNFMVNHAFPLDGRIFKKVVVGGVNTAQYYTSVSEANNASQNPLAYRYKGMTIPILISGTITEYWYRDTTINSGLIVKDVSNITGLVTQGANVTITGNGTSGSPYVINSTGGGSGGSYTASGGITLTGSNFTLTDQSYTAAEKSKLAGIATGATANTGTVTGVTATNSTGQTWTISNATTTPNIALVLASAAVGLGSVDNTSDASKPVSTAQAAAIALKADALVINNAQTGTTYTLQASDNTKTIVLTNAAAITVTIPTGLPTGFNCLLIQGGAGAVTPTAGSGVTLSNATATSAQWGKTSVISIGSNLYIN